MKWVKCGVMPNPKFRVKRPVAVRLERYKDGWLAGSPWLDDCGQGDTQFEAMIDLMSSLTELYELYDRAELGAHLDRNFARLKTYIEPRIMKGMP